MRCLCVALLILCGSCQTVTLVEQPIKAGWSSPRMLIPGHPQRTMFQDI